MKKLLSLMLAAAMAFGSISIAYAADEDREIVIYHTNDTHGYISGSEENTISMAIVAALKEQTEGSVLVDAGDATQGLPIASLTKGADIIDIMNIAGYDLMAAGNHEFDFGKGNLIENAKRAEFKILAANVYDGDKPLLADINEGDNGCHIIIERNGIRLGFFALTTTQTKTAATPEGTKGVTFNDEIETAKEEIDELKSEDVDAIIAVCHMGDGDAPCTSADLANAMTGEYQGELAAIIDGHSHTVENKVENGILIAQTGYAMNALGKITLSIDSDNDVSVTEEQLKYDDVKDIEPNQAVVDKLDEINASQSEMLSEVIGTTPTTLWAGWIGTIPPTRLVETNYGDLAADSYKWAAEEMIGTDIPVVGIENGGGIRAAVKNGSITVGDLVNAFPYSNTLHIKEITPKILYDIMEVSGSKLDGQDPETGMLLQTTVSGGFLQISGFKCVYNPDKTENRVTSITLDGQDEPLDRNDNSTAIALVGNNYIMSGGGSYDMLTDIPKLAEVGGELETVQSYMESCLDNGVLKGYQTAKNRIVMAGDTYIPKDYTAKIKIIDDSSQPVADKEISYIVDGGEKQNGKTTGEGYLEITLSDGSHSVRLGDQTEVYVNNYAGLGILEDDLRAYPQLTYLTDGSCDPVEESTSEVTTEETTETTTEINETATETTTEIAVRPNRQTGGGSSSKTTTTETTIETTTEVPTEAETEETTELTTEEYSENMFNDISSHWAADTINSAAQNGIVSGYSDGSFKPDGFTTRAMFATMLARASKETVSEVDTKFSDVAENSYYADAISWAAQNDIVSGFSDGTFKPDSPITREQAASMLYRYAKYKGIATELGSIEKYTDCDDVSAWALDAVKWSSNAALISGRTATTLNPLENITRAEACKAVTECENL